MLRAIKTQWHNVARRFWFYPELVALGGVILAGGLVEFDRVAGTGGVRSVLSTIAGSLITVADRRSA